MARSNRGTRHGKRRRPKQDHHGRDADGQFAPFSIVGDVPMIRSDSSDRWIYDTDYNPKLPPGASPATSPDKSTAAARFAYVDEHRDCVQ